MLPITRKRQLAFSVFSSLLILLFHGCRHDYPPGNHVFILSGQSNMSRLDPSQSFIPILEEEFGKENIIVVKHAVGGERIHRWYKGWKSTAGDNRQQQGDIYDLLISKVKTAIQDKPIASITFIWMQGESDATSEYYASVYEVSLLGLYHQLQVDLNYPSINWVIGRISDFDLKGKQFKRWEKIREIQVKVAESSPRYTWVNTDDLNDGIEEPRRKNENDLHYSNPGYRILGERFAQAAIELIRNNPQSE